MSTVQLTASSLSYRSTKGNHGSERFTRVFPLNGLSSVPLQQSSTSEIQMEFPNKVSNYGMSKLDFDITVAASGTAGLYNNLHTCGHSMIDRVELRTREGVHLCNVSYYSDYSRATLPYLTKHDDFMTKSESRAKLTSALAQRTGKGSNMFKCDTAISTAAVFGGARAGYRLSSGGTALEAVGNSNTSPNYVTTSADNSDMTVSYSIPFHEIKESLLALDKTLYWGQSLMFVVHLAPVNKIGWQSDATLFGAATPIPIATSVVTVSNIKVLLATETNPDIISMMVSTVQQRGMQLLTPFVWPIVQPSGSSTESNFNQKINSGWGQRLLSVVSVVANNTPTGITSVDINNGVTSETKVSEVQTYLDSNPLQEYRVRMSQNEHFEIMEPLLKGSVVNSVSCYRHNQIFVDSWRDGPMAEFHDNNNAFVEDGLDLSSEHTYQVNYTKTAEDQRHLFFFTTQRTININSNGQISIN